MHSRQDYFSFCVPLHEWSQVALHKFTRLDQFTYQETQTIIWLVHTDTAKHKKRHTQRHACPRMEAQGPMVTMDGGCNYTRALCEKCTSEMRSSLCPYLARVLPQPRNTIVPGWKTLCVYTFAHGCMIWFDTEITQKSSDAEKRLEIHTPRA